MLLELDISNYVLIDELRWRPAPGFSVMTGETGAGKSILLGALGLLLGQRADSSSILNKEKKCILEAVFDIGDYQLKDFFREHDFDYLDQTTIRREITPEGKSRAFINDTPVTLSLLKELSSKLVDVHSQHENTQLFSEKFQTNLVDKMAGNAREFTEYQKAYEEWTRLTASLQALKEEEAQTRQEEDYLRFQFEELNELGLSEGEQESLEAELNILSNQKEIQSFLERSDELLNGEEKGLLLQLKEVIQSIDHLSRFQSKYADLNERLRSTQEELKDISREVSLSLSDIPTDQNRQEWIEERLSTMYRMQKKHRVETVEDLLRLHSDFARRLERIGSFDSAIAALEKELSRSHTLLKEKATQLRQSRLAAIPTLEKEIISRLRQLSMPQAVLAIRLRETTFQPTGSEKLSFQFSANAGVDFRELEKVASGGELSRLMLVLKSLMARVSAMPTIILDEIDTGISGETVSKAAALLREISKGHQVIAISHLPQMAAAGQVQYKVIKEMQKGRNRTQLKELNGDERIQEIARLLSGEKISPAALKNARELLGEG